jgi:5-methylthioadenosine/S-adenosylhomocysteine deaminase
MAGPELADATGASPASPVDLLVRGGTIVTVDAQRRIIGDGAVAVRDGEIVAVGPRREVEARVQPADTIDAHDRYVFPGLVNTHTHLFQTLLKGLGDDRELVDWFREMTGPAAAQLTAEDCYLGAAVGCVEALRSGTTTVKDFMYTHPRPGLMDAVAQAFNDIGVRGVLGRGFCDTGAGDGVPAPLIEDLDDALADCRRVIDRFHGQRLLTVYIAPTMIWTVTERGLSEAAQLAEQASVGFAMHLSETCFERTYSTQRFGRDDFQMLERAGALGPRTLAVHCVHATGDDIALMATHDVKVSHNATSNMYLASGVAPVPSLLEAGLAPGPSDSPTASGRWSPASAPTCSSPTLRPLTPPPSTTPSRRSCTPLPVRRSAPCSSTAASRWTTGVSRTSTRPTSSGAHSEQRTPSCAAPASSTSRTDRGAPPRCRADLRLRCRRRRYERPAHHSQWHRRRRGHAVPCRRTHRRREDRCRR